MKRFLSLGLVIAMVMSLFTAVPALAAEDDSAGLEEAIKAARAQISVPEERTEFSYYLEMAGDGYKVWELSWTDNESGETNVEIDSDGFLVSYNSYDWNSENTGLGSVSLSDGQKAAEDFLKTVLPEGLKEAYFLVSQSSSFGQLSYRYGFKAGDIPISFLSAYFSIDKYTGEIKSYSFNGEREEREVAKKLVSGAKGDAKLSEAEAKAAFIEKIGIDLAYHTSYDYSEKKSTREVFAAYNLNDRGGLYIDAETGELVSRYYVDRFGTTGGSMKNAAASMAVEEDATEEAEDGGSYRLSPEEQAKVDGLIGVLSQGEAVSAIIRQVPAITKDYTVHTSSIRHDAYDEDKYTISVSFDGAYAVVDAFTGELESFSIYNYEAANTGGVSEDRAKATAENFIRGLAGDKFNEVELSDGSDEGPIIYRDSKIAAEPTYEPYSYSFSYLRRVNGLKYSDNGFYATVNRKDGQVVSYSKRWYGSVSFPDVSAAAGASAAFDTFNKGGAFKLMYLMTAENTPSLVYGWDNVKGQYVSLDGKELLDYSGKPYKEATEQLAAYDDVSGRWYEEIVNKLLDNGYFITEGAASFNGGAKISQKEFLNFLYTRERSYYDNDEDFYKWVVGDIVKEDERKPEADLTRADAAKFIVRYLGLGKAGELAGIYATNLYTDSVPAGYEGFAALAKGLGVMQGDLNGAFNGANTMTRAEAAVVIYNALNAR